MTEPGGQPRLCAGLVPLLCRMGAVAPISRILAAAIAGVAVCSVTAQARCQSQSSGILDLSQNSRLNVRTSTDSEGCRISYSLDLSGYSPLHARTMFEKSEIMARPGNGKLEQTGAFTFFYAPNLNFSGKDNFVIYLCGSNLSGKGCTRINYDVTVK